MLDFNIGEVIYSDDDPRRLEDKPYLTALKQLLDWLKSMAKRW